MSANFTPSKPDFTVNALSKSTGDKGQVGVAWRTPEGNVRIKLNAFVVLRGGDDLALTCFDVAATAKKFGKKPAQADESQATPPSTDENVPF